MNSRGSTRRMFGLLPFRFVNREIEIEAEYTCASFASVIGGNPKCDPSTECGSRWHWAEEDKKTRVRSDARGTGWRRIRDPLVKMYACMMCIYVYRASDNERAIG